METSLPSDEGRLLESLAWVKRLALAIVRDRAAADDVAQDVARVALEHGTASIAPGAAWRGWLSAVTRRLALDRVRSDAARRSREHVVARPERDDSRFEIVERTARQQRVARAVMELDEPYRSTVLYRYVDELDANAIAARMGTTPAAVRKRLSRAHALLRERLDRESGRNQNAWALLLLDPGLRGSVIAASAKGGVLLGLKGASIMSTKWLAGAALAAVLLWLGARAAYRSAAQDRARTQAGLSSSLEPAKQREPTIDEFSGRPFGRAVATDTSTVEKPPAAAVNEDHVLRVRVLDMSGAPVLNGNVDTWWSRIDHVAGSPSRRLVSVPIRSEVTEVRLPHNTRDVLVSASVSNLRPAEQVEVRGFDPDAAHVRFTHDHDVVVRVGGDAPPLAIGGEVFVDGERRIPRDFDLRITHENVIAGGPRVNRLDATWAFDREEDTSLTIFATSTETVPLHLELTPEALRAGAVDLRLESGRVLDVTLVDLATGAPLPNTPFTLTTHVLLRRDNRQSHFDADTRRFEADDVGRCEIHGVPAEGSIEIRPDDDPEIRWLALLRSESLQARFLSEPWWSKNVHADGPPRLEVKVPVPRLQPGASAFGYLPPWLLKPTDPAEKVRVVYREITQLRKDGGERYEARFDADGRWSFQSLWPRRYKLWIELVATDELVSEEIEIDLDAARAVGPIEFPLAEPRAVSLSFVDVPTHGTLEVVLVDEQGPSHKALLGGAPFVQSIELHRTTRVRVECRFDEDDSSSALVREVTIDPSRETSRTIALNGASEVTLELVPRGATLTGVGRLRLSRVNDKGLDFSEAAMMIVRDGRAASPLLLTPGRWAWLYHSETGDALLAGVCDIRSEHANSTLKLEPIVDRVPVSDLGSGRILMQVDSVSFEPFGEALRRASARPGLDAILLAASAIWAPTASGAPR